MISFDDAKSHLRVIHEDEDTDIAIKLRLAISIVIDYTGGAVYQEINFESFPDEASYLTAQLKADRQNEIADAATLLVLGELYANRESSSDPLSPSVKTILERLRVPGFA